MASSLYSRRSATNGNTPVPARLLPSNGPPRSRTGSGVTSIDRPSSEDVRKQPAQSWRSRKHNPLMQTMVEEREDVSDAESFDSLSSRAKFVGGLLSDSDSSHRDSISSYGPATPRTPSPEYYGDGFPAVEILDEKSPRLRSSSMDATPAFAAKVKAMTTVGPRGPHLFRSYSTTHATNIEPINIMNSPRSSVPSTPSLTEGSRSPSVRRVSAPSPNTTPRGEESRSFDRVMDEMETHEQAECRESDVGGVRSWSPNQVCAWMAALGFEDMVENFARNDISGAILMDLKWEDLKELNIQSFGKRTELWTEIQHLRAMGLSTPERTEFLRTATRIPCSNSTVSFAGTRGRSGSASSAGSQMMPLPESDDQDTQTIVGDYEFRRLPSIPSQHAYQPQDNVSEADEELSDDGFRLRSRPPLRRKRRTNVRMPQRAVSVDSIVITSDEENPGSYIAKVEALTSFDHHRPLRRNMSLSRRDSVSPSDSVSLRGRKKKKRDGHHTHRCKKGDRCRKHRDQAAQVAHAMSEQPMKPMEERRQSGKSDLGTILIAATPSIADFSGLARGGESDNQYSPRPQSFVPSVIASSDALGTIQGQEVRLKESTLREVSRVDPLENVKQFLTHQQLHQLQDRDEAPPPVPIKASDSISYAQRNPSPPPTTANSHAMFQQTPVSMQRSHTSNSNHPPRCFTPAEPPRAKTPSCGLRTQGMERVVPPYTNFSAPNRVRSPGMMRTTTPFSEADVPLSTGTPFNFRDQSQSVPPDMHYRRFPTPTLESLTAPIIPRSQSTRPAHLNIVDENAEWEPVDDNEVKIAPSPNMRTHSGWMKKRRTNWFRHEWPDHHFVLKGTRLGYANDVGTSEVGAIDMDNYQVACSGSGSTKLSAAFKAGKIFGKKKDELAPGSYFFQLIPAMESTKGKKGIGKVHYFSVNSREERIDWMRELMLAKAIKQKGQGFEVEVNGKRV